MKYLTILIICLFTNFLFGQDTSLSLDECLQMALSNNENLKNSILEENVSKMTMMKQKLPIFIGWNI